MLNIHGIIPPGSEKNSLRTALNQSKMLLVYWVYSNSVIHFAVLFAMNIVSDISKFLFIIFLINGYVKFGTIFL